MVEMYILSLVMRTVRVLGKGDVAERKKLGSPSRSRALWGE